jgi:hypothetical protein
MLRISTSNIKSATTNIEKTYPHPLLLPDKPQNTMQIQNRTQHTAVWKTCAHKTLTTTTKRKPAGHKRPSMQILSSQNGPPTTTNIEKSCLLLQQQPNKPQPKPKTNLKKQPEKTLVHTGQTNNFQRKLEKREEFLPLSPSDSKSKTQ